MTYFTSTHNKVPVQQVTMSTEQSTSVLQHLCFSLYHGALSIKGNKLGTRHSIKFRYHKRCTTHIAFAAVFFFWICLKLGDVSIECFLPYRVKKSLTTQ